MLHHMPWWGRWGGGVMSNSLRPLAVGGVCVWRVYVDRYIYIYIYISHRHIWAQGPLSLDAISIAIHFQEKEALRIRRVHLRQCGNRGLP